MSSGWWNAAVVSWAFKTSSFNLNSVWMSLWTLETLASVQRTVILVDTVDGEFVAFVFALWRWLWNANTGAWATALVFSGNFKLDSDLAWTAWLDGWTLLWNDLELAWTAVALIAFGGELDGFESGTHWVVEWSLNDWALKSSWWWSTRLALEAIALAALATWSRSNLELTLLASHFLGVASVGGFNITLVETGRFVSDLDTFLLEAETRASISTSVWSIPCLTDGSSDVLVVNTLALELSNGNGVSSWWGTSGGCCRSGNTSCGNWLWGSCGNGCGFSISNGNRNSCWTSSGSTTCSSSNDSGGWTSSWTFSFGCWRSVCNSWWGTGLAALNRRALIGTKLWKLDREANIQTLILWTFALNQ